MTLAVTHAQAAGSPLELRLATPALAFVTLGALVGKPVVGSAAQRSRPGSRGVAPGAGRAQKWALWRVGVEETRKRRKSEVRGSGCYISDHHNIIEIAASCSTWTSQCTV